MPKADVERVTPRAKRSVPTTELFVDANGAYTRKQALAQAEMFSELGVTWFEEPVSSDDLEGLRFMRDRAPAGMEIAAGEYGYESFISGECWRPARSMYCKLMRRVAAGFTGFSAGGDFVRSASPSALGALRAGAASACRLRGRGHFRTRNISHDHARIEANAVRRRHTMPTSRRDIACAGSHRRPRSLGARNSKRKV